MEASKTVERRPVVKRLLLPRPISDFSVQGRKLKLRELATFEWIDITEFRAGEPEQKVNLCQMEGSKRVERRPVVKRSLLPRTISDFSVQGRKLNVPE
jgi:hypothetical protein